MTQVYPTLAIVNTILAPMLHNIPYTTDVYNYIIIESIYHTVANTLIHNYQKS